MTSKLWIVMIVLTVFNAAFGFAAQAHGNATRKTFHPTRIECRFGDCAESGFRIEFADGSSVECTCNGSGCGQDGASCH